MIIILGLYKFWLLTLSLLKVTPDYSVNLKLLQMSNIGLFVLVTTKGGIQNFLIVLFTLAEDILFILTASSILGSWGGWAYGQRQGLPLDDWPVHRLVLCEHFSTLLKGTSEGVLAPSPATGTPSMFCLH